MPRRGNAEGTGEVGTKQHMWKSHPDHRVEDDLCPVIRNEGAILHNIAEGHLIQLLLTMIQNAESVVPNATIAVDNR